MGRKHKPVESTALPAAAEAAPTTVQPWTETREPARRRFPGPVGSGQPVRVTMDRSAYADLTQHAKQSLAAEICGVVIGEVCRDDEGLWVDVTATIRGHAASGSSHVTFTQETWTRIHDEKERLHPAAAMVGWYHSHPGFGVEFSEMDTFIHRNFFAAPASIAVLTDPLGGEEAICVNEAGAVRYLDRFWVDGRERRLRLPGSAAPAAGSGVGQPRIDALEARVAQLVGTLDELRERIWSFYLIVGMSVVLVAMLWLGWQFWNMYNRRYEPPEVINEVSIPVRIGDRDVMMLARVYGWKVPPELNSLLLQQIQRDKDAEAARLQEELKRLEDKREKTAADHPAGPTPDRMDKP